MFTVFLTVGRVNHRSERPLWRERHEEEQDDTSPKNLEDHLRRSRALHAILDADPVWRVADWGRTDDVVAHDSVELMIDVTPAARKIEPIEIPALTYMGTILIESGLSGSVVECVKQLVVICRSRQQAGDIGDAVIGFLDDEATVVCYASGRVGLMLRTVVTIAYDAAYNEVLGLGPDHSHTIDVPTPLVPFVRAMIFQNHGRRTD